MKEADSTRYTRVMDSANILDGKAVAAQRLEQLRSALRQDERPPHLSVVLVGNNAASEIYVRNKAKACDRVGFGSDIVRLADDVGQEELADELLRLNADECVDGVLLQLPLPGQIDSALALNAIRPDKDVDGFHAENVGRLALRQPGLRPCTPKGIMTLLNHYGLDVKARHCVVVGASNIVGRPMLLELLLAGATVTCCHRFTRDLRRHVEQAEILIVAVGKPGVVASEWIAPGTICIDVGMNRRDDGRLIGDLDFEAACARAAWITPVPGGVGPMTVASLLENTLQAARLRSR